MKLLINRLRKYSWESTSLKVNGSPAFMVAYGSGHFIRFWNDTNLDDIDCDAICDLLADVLEDDGLGIEGNTIQDGLNTIRFEIFDEEEF
jgi:hypothetical protein